MVARPTPVAGSVQKLRNAQLPEFGLVRLGDIVGLDSALQADSLPAVARPAPPVSYTHLTLPTIYSV